MRKAKAVVVTIIFVSVLLVNLVSAATQTITLKPGLNLVSLKYKPASYYVNDTFAGKLIGGASSAESDVIWKLVPGEGDYKYESAWQVGTGEMYGEMSGKFMGENSGQVSTMKLYMGVGFFIENRHAEKTITIQGTEVGSITTIAFKKGHNFIGVPYEGYTAKSVLEKTGCTNISKWNADKKIYIEYPTNTDFSIQPGAGYLIECGADTSVTFAPISQTPTQGIVSLWKFDEAQGTTAKDSANANHGTIYGASWQSKCISGSCLVFNGNTYVDVSDSNSLDLTNKLTVSLWVYPEKSGSYLQLVAKNQEAGKYSYYFSLNNSKPAVYLGGLNKPGWHETAEAIGLNQWSYVSFTFDGSNLKIYINGILKKTVSSLSGSINTNSQPLWIGSRKDSSNYNFVGKIDEVKIYNLDLKCTDSDGGVDYYMKGKCIDIVESTAEEPLWDSCYDSNNLAEQSCHGKYCAVDSYKCPNGCKDGACIAKPCFDSDGGVDYYTKGNIRYFYNVSSDKFYGLHETDDQCDSDGKVLNEFSCDYYNSKELNPSKKYTCSNGCKDGACISEQEVAGQRQESTTLIGVIAQFFKKLLGIN